MTIDEEIKDFWAQKHTEQHVDILSGSGYRTFNYLRIGELFMNAETLLNIGVGTGTFEKICATCGIVVDSVDIVPEAEKCVDGIVRHFYLTVKNIKPNTYDLITELFVAQHITDEELKLHIKHAIIGLRSGGIYALNLLMRPYPDTSIIEALRSGHLFRPHIWFENIIPHYGGRIKSVYQKHVWDVYHIERKTG